MLCSSLPRAVWIVSAALLLHSASHSARAASVLGAVRTSGGAPISGARVTLFTADLGYFEEERTDATGSYAFPGVPAGSYSLGACALDYEYVEQAVVVAGSDVIRDFALWPDVHPGRWTIIGDTDPENLYATDSGTLMPDGRIFYCHDTEDPVVFDPRTGQKSFPPTSPSKQGCHISSVLPDRRLIFIGGQGTDDFRDAVRTVKTYNPANGGWSVLTPMYEERWYPGMARLADGRLLAIGGGQRPNAQRTRTCEIYDPQSGLWTRTGDTSEATEFAPSVLLLTGEVLRSWYPPQLYSVGSGQWRDTGGLVQPDRFFPGHSDHTMVLLADGRAMICGVYRGDLANPSMVELYDPASETWSLGATPEATRSQPEVVMLPTGRVLCAGGRLEDNDPSVPTNEWGQTKLTDLYDPDEDRWQRMADMAHFREYHAVTVLVPDGRVVTTAGTGGPAQPGISNDVEAFEPPYLFRGVRPRIDAISTVDLKHAQPFTMNVSRTEAVTSVVLIGTNAVTHWVDGGVPRILSVSFSQQGNLLVVTPPADPVAAPMGCYLLFAMVDDIPSEGIFVTVGAASATGIDDAPPPRLVLHVYPNPVREGTDLLWYQVVAGPARFSVFDVTGRSVAAHDLGSQPVGWRHARWNAVNGAGTGLASGVYWIQLESPRESRTRPLVLRP